MNKQEYIQQPEVKSFIEWAGARLDIPGAFVHSYTMKRPKGVNWNCNSIYNAFEQYQWSFTCSHPLSGIKITGRSFQESHNLLSKLAEELKSSVVKGDVENCKKYSFAILDWGGVLPRNNKKIEALGSNITAYFASCQKRIHPAYFDTDDQYDDIIMNAGFTKIYSLLMDDFVIYDGRVGAALGLMVRQFCQEYGLNKVPEALRFAYGNARQGTYTKGEMNRRNPSTAQYRFPQLTNNYRLHTENNLKANWLLKELVDSTSSRFSLLPKEIKLRALESALFMIGYDVCLTSSPVLATS